MITLNGFSNQEGVAAASEQQNEDLCLALQTRASLSHALDI